MSGHVIGNAGRIKQVGKKLHELPKFSCKCSCGETFIALSTSLAQNKAQNHANKKNKKS